MDRMVLPAFEKTSASVWIHCPFAENNPQVRYVD